MPSGCVQYPVMTGSSTHSAADSPPCSVWSVGAQGPREEVRYITFAQTHRRQCPSLARAHATVVAQHRSRLDDVSHDRTVSHGNVTKVPVRVEIAVRRAEGAIGGAALPMETITGRPTSAQFVFANAAASGNAGVRACASVHVSCVGARDCVLVCACPCIRPRQRW